MGELAIPNRGYETIYVLKPDTARDAAEGLANRLLDVVKSSGRLTKVENWGRRRLAYAVSNHKRGIYIYMAYEGRGDVVPEVERALRLSESVMKFQTVKLSEVASGDVAPEDVQFEHVETDDDEEDETLAESLGLEARSRWSSDSNDDSNDSDDDSDDSDADNDDDSSQNSEEDDE